jgi:hypothetical protein
MDRWAWTQLEPWIELRRDLPVGRLFCVVRGPTRGRSCASAGIRPQLHSAAALDEHHGLLDGPRAPSSGAVFYGRWAHGARGRSGRTASQPRPNCEWATRYRSAVPERGAVLSTRGRLRCISFLATTGGRKGAAGRLGPLGRPRSRGHTPPDLASIQLLLLGPGNGLKRHSKREASFGDGAEARTDRPSVLLRPDR